MEIATPSLEGEYCEGVGCRGRSLLYGGCCVGCAALCEFDFGAILSSQAVVRPKVLYAVTKRWCRAIAS